MKKSATAAIGFSIVPSHVMGKVFGHTAPSDKLNIAGIGIGGMGRQNLSNMNTENIVALCDVNWDYALKTFNDYPTAKRYKDWRVMFDEMGKSIDAIMVATPDHTHALISAHAMTLGKHVYTQKPLTHSVYESRLLTRLAEKYRVATQMGNQGSSYVPFSEVCELIWEGTIGEVTEVHAWTNRPIWPQGLQRPEETMEIPSTLDWDLFLSHAPYRPYHSVYTPWNWRGWWDFGTGALGDMACHLLDTVFYALDLKYPIKVSGSSTLCNTESCPHAEMVKYTFPERPTRGKVKMPELNITWYDGGMMPPRPAGIADGEIMGEPGGGVMYIGSKGKIVTGCYGRYYKVLKDASVVEVNKPNPVIRRVKDGEKDVWSSNAHEQDWIRACKESPENRVQPISHFGFSGPFNEAVVMAVLAVRLQDLKRELLWDGEQMRFTNINDTDTLKIVSKDDFKVIDGDPRFDRQFVDFNAKQVAEEWIKHTYHNGFSLPPMP